MSWKERVFSGFKLYAVTDIRHESRRILRTVEAAYREGAEIIQLRSKQLSDEALIRIGLEIRKISRRHRKLFFMNDRVDLALAARADGVHLGQEDMPLAVARTLIRKAGQKMWIGKSTHSLNQALAAVQEGADYIGIGPVFATPTKPCAKSVGLELVRQAAGRVRIPWVAIGGIDLTNIGKVTGAGATRIAVVRAIFSAKDAGLATKNLKLELEGIRHG
jgi:thiamine-phosphate pyrophosphorylase